MKKLTVAAITLLLLSSFSYAQEVADDDFEAGPPESLDINEAVILEDPPALQEAPAVNYLTNLVPGEMQMMEYAAEEKTENQITESPDIEQILQIMSQAEGEAIPMEEENPAPLTITELPNSILNETNRNHPLVVKHREQYLSEKWLKWLRQVLEDSMEYRLYVRKMVQEMDLPPELEYLPVVESNYKTSARSRSGALGMWQFMENSVKPFLQLDEFVDERLDPWKSTSAGLRKLKDNYNQFKDWYLAIGAYNCGAGAMSKAVKKSGQEDFWYLADNALISNQTVNYVPKLLAIADLAEHSDFYQIDLPMHEEEYELLVNERDGVFDYIEVNQAYMLSTLAAEMRMSEKTIKHLNPGFTKGFTHPSKKSQIRLPPGMKESGLEALANIKPVSFPFQYKVVSGDSLWSISRKYGVTVQTLCEVNGIKENAILRIGKILYIPEK